MTSAKLVYFLYAVILAFMANFAVAMIESDNATYLEEEIENDPRYQELCRDEEIKLALAGQCEFVDVKMDKILIAPISQQKCIGSHGFANCIAICARGKNKKGEKLLGFCHSLSLEDFESVHDDMKAQMENFAAFNCLPESIEFFVVGGYPHFFDQQKKFLDLIYKNKNFNVKEIKFNISGGDDDPAADYYVQRENRIEQGIYGGITIVIIDDGIFYAKNNNFSIFFKARQKLI